MIKLIERTDKEYMEDMRKIYDDELKPLLDDGYSLTNAFRKIGVATGTTARKSRELRQMALDDGYVLRR